MSKQIQIGEHIFSIPTPKNGDKILFSDMADPCWNRGEALKDYREIWYEFIPGKGGTKLFKDATHYDDDGDLVSLNKEDSDWIIWAYEREWNRRANGVFFKNGKEIVWVTGDHWFTLAWCKTKRPDKKGEYFDYREFQAEFFYLIWKVNNEPDEDGCFFSKAKKTGITNLMWLYYLNKSTMTKNCNLGCMNIDKKKAAKTFKDHFLYAFNGLPLALRPAVKNLAAEEGIITFGERANKSKRSSRQKNVHEDELNTTVMCVATAISAFDVDVFTDTWYDEPPKVESDFGAIYQSNSEGTKLQDIAVGKKWLTSYTPEGNAPSFTSSKKIFYDSELRTVNADVGPRTRSGMICYHIPAFISWTSSFDKYGKCDQKAAMAKIQARRDALKDSPREQQAEIRRYANNKREAWTTGGAGSVFDNVRLSELLVEIEEEQRNSILPPYKEGKLEWQNKFWEIGLKNKRPKGYFCPVEFIPLTYQERTRNETGRLRIYNDIPDSLKNVILKNGKDEWGCLKPPTTFTSFLGADPTSHAAASEVIEGSKNAYYVENAVDHRLDNMMGYPASGICTFEYFYRPELPDEAYEDLVKLIIYTGSLCGVEANVPTSATRLLEEGLGRFMLIKDKFGIYRIWERWMGLPHEEEKEYHLLRTTANSPDTRAMLEYFVRLWIAYIQTPKDGEKDYGKTIKSERVINQLMNLDVTDTKTADLFMASGYGKFVRDQYSAILLSNKNKEYGGISITDVLKAFARA